MKFLVLSRRQAGKQAPSDPHVTISITDPSKPEAELAFSYLRRDVLRLSFRSDISFRTEHATEILRFMDTYRHKVSTVVIHCETGMNDSVSVTNILRKLLVDDISLLDFDYYVHPIIQQIMLEEAWRQHWPRGERLIGDAIAPIEEITLGGSGTRVAQFKTEYGAFIRKAGHSPILAHESWVLHALDGVTPLAPRFVGRDGEAFFQTALPGIPLSTAIHADPERVARLFGQTLREVHALTPELAHNPRDEWTRFQRNEGIEMLPAVFSHGDWCLPNVLTDGERVTGIVDWGDGGWRDPRLDLGTGLWTLRFNLGGKQPAAEKAFLDGYGWTDGAEPLEAFVALYENGA